MTYLGVIAFVGLIAFLVYCGSCIGDTDDERNDRGDWAPPDNVGAEEAPAPTTPLSPMKAHEMKNAPPYMPAPGGAVPFKNVATPRNAKSNAANKLPRKAKHSKPRGMA